MRKFLEISLQAKERLGFYNEVTDTVDVDVLHWFKKQGDVIGATENQDTLTVEGDAIFEGESAKGAFTLQATGWEIGATLVEILIPEGERVTIDLRQESLKLAVLEVPDDGVVPPTPVKESVPVISEVEPPNRITPLARELAEDLGVSLPDKGGETFRVADVLELVPTKHGDEFTAPATRQRAKELGVDLSQAEASGPDGIIRARDVEALAKESMEPTKTESVPVVSLDGDVEVIRPSLRHLTTAKNMAEAWLIPHASPGIDINPEFLMNLHKKMREDFERIHGVKLRMDYFFVKACAWLLSQPEFRILNGYFHENFPYLRVLLGLAKESEWSGEIYLYPHVNVGIAAAISPENTRNGFSELVTPVVKYAEEKSLVEIAKEADRLIEDAFAGKPKPQDQIGLTFIVNNTGTPVEWKTKRSPGDEYPDPIIAPHNAAIVAFGAARSELGIKRMTIRLRFDHRLVNGHEPKRFLRALQDLLENPEQIPALG